MASSYRNYFNSAHEGLLRGVEGEIGILSLADFILRRLQPEENSRLLDLGCGDGRVLNTLSTLRPDLDCVGLDFAENLISQAKSFETSSRKLSFQVADLTTCNFQGIGKFSYIFSFSVLQYLSPSQVADMNQRLLNCTQEACLIAHLSVPDLDKRILLFQDDFLNRRPSELAGPGLLNLLRMCLVDRKRRWSNNRAYGNSRFHQATEMASAAPPGFTAQIIRPSDSWYRFDVLYRRD